METALDSVRLISVEAGYETGVGCRVRFSHSASSSNLVLKDCSHVGMGLIRAGDDAAERVNVLYSVVRVPFQAIVAVEGPPPLPDVSRSGMGSCALGAKECSMKRTWQTISC